jgi:hypothetical protein
MPALTRSDFESAVKDALRHYTQADLLAGNALLYTRLLTGSGSDATTPQALRTLLADTAKICSSVNATKDCTAFSSSPI